MNKIFATLAILFLIGNATFGKIVGNYDWQKDRKRYVLSEKENAFNEYILLYHKEFNYDWENSDLYIYQTEHAITRVKNSEAIQRHNRIYVSLRNVLEVVEIKARSISKDGKITTFDRNNLKEVKDENSDNSFKIFAIEGIESDSEVEYFYTLKKSYNSWETVYFQFETPVKEGSFLFSSPIKLEFAFKVYFDSGKVTLDTLNNRNLYIIGFKNVEGTIDEKFAYPEANRKRVEMKLAFNLTKSTGRLNTWADAAKSYYKYLVKTDADGVKQTERFAKSLGDNKSWPAEKRIKNVDDKIKNSIKIIEHAATTAPSDVPDILKYKQASVEGVTRLFVLVFETLQIPYRLVVTSDRESKKFDGSFDSWGYLTEYLLFFPETNKFISPYDNVLRYPLVPSRFTANKGLFIEPVSIGKVKSALASIEDIPALPDSYDKVDHVITASIKNDLATVDVSQKLTFAGNDAALIINYVSDMTPDDKDKYVRELVKNYSVGASISSWSVSSSVVDDIPYFSIQSDFTTDNLIEHAGQKILFKVGELIGPQTELYRDENRRYDIENTRNRGYDRKITLAVPKGYKVNNLDALNMNVAYQDENSTPFLFKSEFVIQESQINIVVEEYYKNIYAPRSRYEDFRKVVNASADFNKIVIVVEK